MHRLTLFRGDAPKRLLVLGAHADDIEIGCGGTVLRLCAEHPDMEVTWVVFCATPERAVEAEACARSFLAGVDRKQVLVKRFRDGFLPYAGASVKEEFEGLKGMVSPDLILTHQRADLHQDHRVVSELTWNTWRNHFILEYEIPKYDGDFGSPSFFVPLAIPVLDRKIKLLMQAFPSQAGKPWFAPELFRAVARIRGMECAARDGFAEAFYCRKATL
jgi:LmbE family N-acetylglucosaminyl deacetylase